MGASTTAAQLISKTAYGILIIMGICHLLNDSLQAVVPTMFPILEASMGLNYTQLLPLLGIFTMLIPSDTVVKKWHQE